MLEKNANVIFRIYNAENRLVFEDDLGIRNKGKHSWVFNNTNLPEGVYYYEIGVDRMRLSKPMIIVK
jgi:flagellar hook assembly protein FlgD